MPRINLFYIFLIIIGLALVSTIGLEAPQEASFYGLADSRATEINYNYPVVVDRILVKEGQAVGQGDTLLQLSRRQAKETMDDQEFRITELRAEQALWKEKTKSEIERSELEKQAKVSDMVRKVEALRREIEDKKRLFQGLQTVNPPSTSYAELELAIKEIELEIEETKVLYDTKIEGLEAEMRLGRNPYTAQIQRYEAQQVFEENQKLQHIAVTAPTNGLVGNINCKEAEHISSYTSLLTFYEPHSTTIKGYVHEDLTMQVKMGQRFSVSSLKEPTLTYQGTVIGLGSRIVEIPSRLRKIETLKAYGREVLLEIPVNNDFLQKEKVSIEFVDHQESNW